MKREEFMELVKSSQTADGLLDKVKPMITPSGPDGALLPEDSKFAKAMGISILVAKGGKSDWDKLQAAGITTWSALHKECWLIQQGKSKLSSSNRIICQLWYVITKNHIE